MSLTLTRRHNVDRFGYLIPTRYGNVPMVGAVATYRPGEGRFGGAVGVEEATTNLLKDVANFTTGSWDRRNVDVTSLEYNGMPGARFTPTGADTAWVHQIFLGSGAAGRTFTWSFYARGQTARTFHVNFYGGVSGTFQSYVIQLTTEWRRYSITHTFPATATSGRIQWGNSNPYWGTAYLDWIEVAGVQVEEKPFATSFVNGTRAAGQLRYPWNWFKTPFTWAFWLRPGRNRSDYSGRIQLLRAMQNGPDYISVEIRADYAHKPFAFVFWQSSVWHQYERTVDFSAGEWLFVALAFDGATGRLYVGRAGTLYSVSGRPTILVGGPGYLLVNPSLLDFLFGELLILPYAASEDEIRAWYEATGPLPPHPQATLQWDWQAVRPATMVTL